MLPLVSHIARDDSRHLDSQTRLTSVSHYPLTTSYIISASVAASTASIFLGKGPNKHTPILRALSTSVEGRSVAPLICLEPFTTFCTYCLK